MIYQIKDWDTHFENDRSRTREKCSFVCVPNKQHGMGFSYIMREKDGAAIYGIFHMIVGACSQQKKRNGWLTDNGEQAGTAWGVDDLSVKFRRPEEEIRRALNFLTSEKVGWIIIHKDVKEKVLETTPLPLPAGSPPTHPEGKGREVEGKEPIHHPPGDGGVGVDDFEKFWEAYPRKVGKQEALKVFNRLKKPPINKILAALEEQKKTEQWRKDGGQFIPHPATWLNRGSWDDQPDISVGSKKADKNPDVWHIGNGRYTIDAGPKREHFPNESAYETHLSIWTTWSTKRKADKQKETPLK